jgi:hypothetical protein
MGPLSLFQSIYDLDTLDTRFTSSATVPYQTVIDARSDPAASREPLGKNPSIQTSPPKWRTPEFYFYYVVFVLAVPLMFWIPYRVSGRTFPTSMSWALASEGGGRGEKADSCYF